MPIVNNTENLSFTVNKNTEWIADTFADIVNVADGEYVYVKDIDEIWYKENGNLYEVTKNHSNVSNDTILINDLRNSTLDKSRVLIIDKFKEGWFLHDPTDTTSVDNTGTILVDNEGKRFKRIFEGPLSVKWFGALGDNSQDDQPSIQSAIHYGITNKHKVYLPIGTYRIDQPILIGRSLADGFINNFVNFELEGESKPYIAGSSPTIVANFNDKFAIGIQRGRGVKISNLHIVGQNTLNFTPKQSFDNLESQWVVNGCRDERYSPYTGLIIDPFGNSIPVDGGYTGMGNYYQQVGNGGSTGIDLHNIDITGFVVGFAFSINGNTQNCDQINLENPKIFNCKSGMAFGQSQTKGISVNNIQCWGSTRFLFDGLAYGVGNGYMPNINGGTIAGGVRSLARFTSSWTPLNVQNLFAEYIYTIGYSVGSGLNNTSFINCNFQFNTDKTQDIKVATCLYSGSNTSFESCTLRYYDNINRIPITFNVLNGLRFSNCYTSNIIYNGFNDQGSVINNVIYKNHIFTGLDHSQGSFSSGEGHHNAYISGSDMLISNSGYITLTAEASPKVIEKNSRGIVLYYLEQNNITVTGNEATFTTVNPGLYQIGDVIISETFFSYAQDSMFTINYRSALGSVQNVVGNLVTLENISDSLINGNYECYSFHIPTYRHATFATGSLGSTILSVNCVDIEGIWSVGSKIRGVGVVDGTYIVSRSNLTSEIVISHPLSATITNENLYDAEVVKIGYSTGAPTTGGWVAGDIVYNTANDNISLWKCKTGGNFGTSLIPTFINI